VQNGELTILEKYALARSLAGTFNDISRIIEDDFKNDYQVYRNDRDRAVSVIKLASLKLKKYTRTWRFMTHETKKTIEELIEVEAYFASFWIMQHKEAFLFLTHIDGRIDWFVKRLPSCLVALLDSSGRRLDVFWIISHSYADLHDRGADMIDLDGEAVSVVIAIIIVLMITVGTAAGLVNFMGGGK